MLFLFSSGQGNLIFALPVTPEDDREVAGGGLRHWVSANLLASRCEGDRWSTSMAMVWLGNVQIQSCLGTCPWKSQGSAAGEEGARFGVPGL